jgi:hypothetical protein
MIKQPYHLANTSFLVIPMVIVASGGLFNSINPELAAGYPDYARHYRLLELAKMLSLLLGLLLCVVLWFCTCALVIKAKARRQRWLVVALLGPLGFIILSLLKDAAPANGAAYLSSPVR